MRKLLIISILFLLVAFSLPVSASAATNAGVKPNSFFYFFDTASEKVNLFFTFNPEKKAKKALEYANERLAEAETIADSKDFNIVKDVMENYTANITLASEKSKEVKDQQASEGLFSAIADNTSKNQEVLNNVLAKVPEEAKDAILKAIEASKKEQEEATKQIVELKGEVEKLKQEVAELKQEKTEKLNDDEKLRLETEKVKFEAETAKAKTEIEKLKLEAKKFEIEKNAKNEAEIKEQAEMEEKNRVESEATILLQAEQETEYLKWQNELIQQQKEERQQEIKLEQINSFKQEYQNKINDINSQILSIKEKYYNDVEDLKSAGGMSQYGLDRYVSSLTDKANLEIQKLQIEAERLQLEYQNKINNIQ